ncbi:hypothetical protein [Streptosporangium sp. NPDC023615]|uniref:hypothetical protein n=1 Tax=Streptosporangium sp. NPDC023615 TaxID=3154794 RepID=UPI003436B591
MDRSKGASHRFRMSLGDLVEHRTSAGAEQDLVAAKHRDTQLGFAPLPKFYGRFDRFPRGRAELRQPIIAGRDRPG